MSHENSWWWSDMMVSSQIQWQLDEADARLRTTSQTAEQHTERIELVGHGANFAERPITPPAATRSPNCWALTHSNRNTAECPVDKWRHWHACNRRDPAGPCRPEMWKWTIKLYIYYQTTSEYEPDVMIEKFIIFYPQLRDQVILATNAVPPVKIFQSRSQRHFPVPIQVKTNLDSHTVFI